MPRNKNIREIREICKDFRELLTNEKTKKAKYNELLSELRRNIRNKIDTTQLEELFSLSLELVNTKGSVLRQVELDLLDDIKQLPGHLVDQFDAEPDEGEVISTDEVYEHEPKKTLARLLKFALELLALKETKGKAGAKRRTFALEIIQEIDDYYSVYDCKNIFIKYINSTDSGEQYTALSGLENYYGGTDEKLSVELKQNLEKIIKETKDRSVAYLCLQIQINAGAIDELEAVVGMDTWKDENYNEDEDNEDQEDDDDY